MKKITFYLFATVIILTASSGCRKDIYGCTDPSAPNYAPNANVDNGACRYYGNIMFWAAADFGNNITVTIQNQSGTISDTYTTSQPTDCNTDVHCANFNLLEGNYPYTASAPMSNQYPHGVTWSGTATVIGNG
jgi:hypothetical protein